MSRGAKNLMAIADQLRSLADCADRGAFPTIAQRCRAAALIVDGGEVEAVPLPVGAIHHRGVGQVVDMLIDAAVESWAAGTRAASERLTAAAFYVGAGIDVEAER